MFLLPILPVNQLNMQTEALVLSQTQKKTENSAMLIIGMLFFIFGFVTWLNGTLIPFLKIACELKTDIQAFFVTFSFYMAYFFLAIPSSYILKKTGFKNGMALGLLVMAIGSLIFIPAAANRNFGLFLTGLFVQGTGLSLLQTASNPYISIVGPIESAAKRISIMGICNKVAGALSPIILGAIVLKDAGSLETKIAAAANAAERETLLNELAGRVIVPYLVITVILVLLAYVIKRSSLPEIDTEKDDASNAEAKNKTSVFQFPHLLLGVLCLFLYVGVEVMAGDAIGMYGRTSGISLDTTKYFTTFTLLSMLLGYIIGVICIPKIISQEKSLMISAILGLVFTSAAFLTTGYVAITFIALLGLANALMWPAIFPLAIEGLGRYTKIGSALLIMGIAGGAIIPLIYGSLKEKPAVGNSLAFFICTLPAYIYILYYAVSGHKQGKRKLVI
jgi:FHS family L-fucose permease-like MFS transporter